MMDLWPGETSEISSFHNNNNIQGEVNTVIEPI